MFLTKYCTWKLEGRSCILQASYILQLHDEDIYYRDGNMCFGWFYIYYVKQLLRVLYGSTTVRYPLQPAAPPLRSPSLSVKQGPRQLTSSRGRHYSTGGSGILPFPVGKRDWMRRGSSSPEQTQHLCDGEERPAGSSSGRVWFCKGKSIRWRLNRVRFSPGKQDYI